MKRPWIILFALIVAGIAGVTFYFIQKSGTDVRPVGASGNEENALSRVTAAATLPETISFNRHVQPILSANCYPCHGPDANTRKSGLRLDGYEYLLQPADSGRPVFSADNPGASPLIERLTSADPDWVMPPPDAHPQPSAEERALLVQWVREGAVYEEHWAFVPPERPEVPELDSDDWSRHAIDRFVLRTLREHGLDGNGPESPRRLIRRLSLDLTGLLPDPADADAFAADPSDAAYEALVDKYLASPAFGEHRARYWLDYVRYADTHGLHFDNLRSIWPYRDYIVRAFNQNKPFDVFVREQLAGDLLPNADLDALVATGYIRSNVSTNEGGTITEEIRINNSRDRAEAFGTTFLGLTVGCASCHDHKFDPVTAKDFYQITAFFNNLTEKGWDENIAEPPPILRLPPDEKQEEAEALLAKIAETRYQLRTRQAEADQHAAARLKAGDGPEAVSTENLELRLRLDEGEGDTVRNSAPGKSEETFTANTTPLIWREQSLLWPGMRMEINTRLPLGGHGDVEADEAFSAGGWIMLRIKPGNARMPDGALLARMGGPERNAHRGWDIWVEKERFAVHIIHQWPDHAIKVRTKDQFLDDRWYHVFVTYDGSRKAENVAIYVDGEPVETEILNDTLTPGLTIRTDAQMHLGRRDDLQPKRETRFQDIRFYRRALSADEAARVPFEDYAAEIVAQSSNPADWTADQRFVMHRFVFSRDTEFHTLQERLAALEASYVELTKDGPATLIAREAPKPAFAHILNRGVYSSLGERVEPGPPGFLPPFPEDAKADRLALANWLVSPENPLLARVTVNRIWQEVFGRGIVTTPGDFGIVGDRPTHPDLLDWLAVEFRESGWDIKGLYKTLVLSATYRQSSRITPDALEGDPANRFYSRAPRFRMAGEMIRDAALQASGLLVDKRGGPPVKPYQPPGIWQAVSMPESNTKKYERDSGEALYRRSLYTFWKRFAPPASLETFDATSREVVCAARARTNTPLQALVTMNDPQFVEASRALAKQVVEAADEPEERLDRLALLTLARELKPEEEKPLLEGLEFFRSRFTESPETALALLEVGELPRDPALDAVELASWTLVANQFFNLDEFLNK